VRIAVLIALTGMLFCGCGAEPQPPPDSERMMPSSQAVPIGVYAGSSQTQNVAEFGRRLGRPVDLAHDYLGHRTWAAIEDVYHIADSWRQAGFDGRTVITVPMLPDKDGSLANGALGRYDEHFRHLAQRLVDGGHAAATLRLGPEFNGTWFRWTTNVRDGAKHYAIYFRQIVRTMRSVRNQRFRFDWSPNAGSSYVGGDGRQLSATRAYPGDRYVDFIGLDVFDQSWATRTRKPADRWRQLVRQKDGLSWHARFAGQHHKAMTFPEWGVVRRSDARGGGDNPYFVERMHDWIESHPVAYHLYFESSDPNGDYRIFGGHFPKAAAAFVRLFGANAPATPLLPAA
jgi:hypothetical protein